MRVRAVMFIITLALVLFMIVYQQKLNMMAH